MSPRHLKMYVNIHAYLTHFILNTTRIFLSVGYRILYVNFENNFINNRNTEQDFTETVKVLMIIFFLNLFMKYWAGFIKTSPQFDEEIQEKLISSTFSFLTTFSKVFSNIDTFIFQTINSVKWHPIWNELTKTLSKMDTIHYS